VNFTLLSLHSLFSRIDGSDENANYYLLQNETILALRKEVLSAKYKGQVAAYSFSVVKKSKNIGAIGERCQS
jgi:hypothetical protein